MITPYQCRDCGKPHPKGCHAHSKVRDTNGQATGKTKPCGLAPVTGLTVCQVHGGRAPQAQPKIAAAKATARAEREVARLTRRVTPNPVQALIGLVHLWATHVAYWAQVVEEIEAEGGHEALTWGVTREKTGGDDAGTTEEAKPHVAYQMLERASIQLRDCSAAAVRAGVDVERLRIANAQGELTATAVRGVMNAGLALIRQHVTDPTQCAALEAAWATEMPTIAAAEIRKLDQFKEPE